MKTYIIALSALAGLSLGSDLSQTFEKAYFLETAKGKSREAVALYRKIAASEVTNENRQIVVKSLRRLLQIYTKGVEMENVDLHAYLAKLNLDFERGVGNYLDHLPQFWGGGGQGYSVKAVQKPSLPGEWCGEINQNDSKGVFGTLTSTLKPEFFGGRRVRLRGMMKLEEVTGVAGLWLRSDVDKKTATFYNMHDQKISGTRDWKEYSFEIEIPEDATNINFGALLSGGGTLWVDDLKIEIVEKK